MNPTIVSAGAIESAEISKSEKEVTPSSTTAEQGKSGSISAAAIEKSPTVSDGATVIPKLVGSVEGDS